MDLTGLKHTTTFDITYPPFTGITPEFLLSKLTKLEDWCYNSIDNFLEVKDNLKVNGHSVPAFEDLLGLARELNTEIEQECYNLQNIVKNHAEPMRVKRKKLKMSMESYKRFFENDNPLFLNKIKRALEKSLEEFLEGTGEWYFSGGCYDLAKAIGYVLSSVNMHAKIWTHGQGNHDVVEFIEDHSFWDAFGSHKTLEEKENEFPWESHQLHGEGWTGRIPNNYDSNISEELLSIFNKYKNLY